MTTYRFLMPLLIALMMGAATSPAKAADEVPPAFVAAHDLAARSNPPDLSCTLRIKDGRSVFHLGEEIPIELLFQNKSGAHYTCLDWDAGRPAVGRLDQFATDRPGDAIDPWEMTEVAHRMSVGGFTGYWPVVSLGGDVVTADTLLNDWLALDRPGVYHIYDTTYRVSRTATDAFQVMGDGGSLPVVSTIVTVTILPYDPVWEMTTLQCAVKGMSGYGEAFALRRIVHLRSRSAGFALLNLVEDRLSTTNMRDLIAYLADSPYRRDLFAKLRFDFTEPKVGITNIDADAYATLAFFSRDWITTNEAIDAFSNRSAFDGYESAAYALLSSSVGKKRGRARAISLETLAWSDRYSAGSPYTRELKSCFDQLPPETQCDLLTRDTPYAYDRSMEPVLVRIIHSPFHPADTSQRQAKNIALQRLLDYDPATARRIILDAITQKWPRFSSGPLMRLPGSSPNLDALLLKNFQLACVGKADVETQAYLVGRYGSAALREPVEQAYLTRRRTWGVLSNTYTEQSGYLQIMPQLFAYFYRVDPEFAKAHASEEAEMLSGQFKCMAEIDLSQGLRKALVDGLNGSDTDVIDDSAQALSVYGDASDKAELLRTLDRVHGTSLAAQSEVAVARALATSPLWSLSAAEVSKIRSAIPDEADDVFGDSNDHQIKAGCSVYFDNYDPSNWQPGFWTVDQYSLDTEGQLKQKLLQYPQGTQFTVNASLSGRDIITKDLGPFLTAHGMSIAGPKSN